MLVVFLEIHPSFEAAFAAARHLGVRVAYLTANAANAEAIAGRVNEVLLVPSLSFEGTARAIDALRARAGDITAVWTVKDYYVPLAAALNARFASSKNVFSVRAAAISKNKLLMRRAYEGSPYNPAYTVIDADQAGEAPFEKCVLKPFLGYSSIGVELVKDRGDFAAAVARSASTLPSLYANVVVPEDDETMKFEARLICEEFVGGEEYSVEVFVNRGRAQSLGICGKSPMVAPYFEEISYAMPAAIPAETAARLEDAACDVVERLGINWGMAHLEFKVDGDRIVLLDIGLRIGGGGLAHDQAFLSSGREAATAVLAQLCELDPEPYLRQTCEDSMLLYLFQVREGGRVVALPSALSSEPEDGASLVRVVHLAAPGDALRPYPNYSGHPGYALFKIEGRGPKAEARIDELLRRCEADFRITYAPHQGA